MISEEPSSSLDLTATNLDDDVADERGCGEGLPMIPKRRRNAGGHAEPSAPALLLACCRRLLAILGGLVIDFITLDSRLLLLLLLLLLLRLELCPSRTLSRRQSDTTTASRQITYSTYAMFEDRPPRPLVAVGKFINKLPNSTLHSTVVPKRSNMMFCRGSITNWPTSTRWRLLHHSTTTSLLLLDHGGHSHYAIPDISAEPPTARATPTQFTSSSLLLLLMIPLQNVQKTDAVSPKSSHMFRYINTNTHVFTYNQPSIVVLCITFHHYSSRSQRSSALWK